MKCIRAVYKLNISSSLVDKHSDMKLFVLTTDVLIITWSVNIMNHSAMSAVLSPPAADAVWRHCCRQRINIMTEHYVQETSWCGHRRHTSITLCVCDCYWLSQCDISPKFGCVEQTEMWEFSRSVKRPNATGSLKVTTSLTLPGWWRLTESRWLTQWCHLTFISPGTDDTRDKLLGSELQ